MSISKHTPAPWNLETVDTSCGICHKIGPFPWKDNKKNHACVYVDYPGNGPFEEELLANAQLIASAPEILDALVTLRLVVGLTAFKYEAQREALQEAMNLAGAAIAKAKGEA